MVDAAGRQPHPDDADRERSWSGADWSDEMRPSASGRSTGAGVVDRVDRVEGADGVVGAHGEPDHSPQLHRALSAAMSDLDAMDDRISTLFDRSDDATGTGTVAGAGAGAGARAQASAEVAIAPVTDDDDIIDLFGEGDVAWTEDDAPVERHGAVGADRMAIISQYEEDIGGAFADLDAELAAETPDQPKKAKRRKFGRHAKGTASAKKSS